MCDYNAFPGYWCSREHNHEGPCALRREFVSKPIPWWERKVGGWTGSVLAILAKRALKRGDTHEFNHLLQAVIWGNSSHSERWPCRLDEVRDGLA